MHRDLPQRHRGSRYHLYTPVDALALFPQPHYVVVIALHKRRLPFPVGSRPAKGRLPLQPASLPLFAVALASCSSPLRAGRLRLPLADWPLAAWRPQRSAIASITLQATVPASACRPMCALATAGHPLVGGQVVASHPCRWPSHGQLPPFLIAFAAEM
ncbi:hypothetical protein B296_00000978 [Ensete ventricosum]|uniref:Uncharacterized protein n=1 Tax=Ensete ventricosum TaxID=4639 RepID=A0A427A7Z3_ENSVE|nr:hypothetical protein B296_00000978 [Ensete ventricosum]